MGKVNKILVICFLCSIFAASAAFASTLYYGSVTDSNGDSSGDVDSAAFDFISGSALVTENDLVLTTNFAAGFDWNHASIGANIDMDQNPATGFPGRDSSNSDSTIFGTDYVIAWGGYVGYTGYNLLKFNGLGFDNLGTGFATTHSANSASVTIPLTFFGGETVDIFNFDFLSQKVLSDSTATGILDYMPNIGSYGTTSPVPEPITMLLFVSGLISLAGVSRRKK